MNKLKALGLAFIAVMAMSAVVAQAAQAGVALESEGEYPQTVTGEGKEIGEKFTTEAGSVECAVSHYHGSLTETGPTLTVKPTYTECQAFGFLSATVNTEECHYLFHGTEHHAATGTFTAHVTIECPEGQSIKITASTCKAEVKGGQSLTTVDITNMANTPPTKPDITVKPTVKEVAYTVTQDGFLCPFSGTGNKTGGEYSSTGYITVTAPGGLRAITTP